VKFRFIKLSDPYYKSERMLRWEVLEKPLGIPPDFSSSFQEEKSFHLIAIEKKEIVGCVLCHPLSATEGEIYDFVCSCEGVDRSFGRKMLSRLEEFLLQKGLSHIYVMAKEEEVDFFSRMGYAFEDPPVESSFKTGKRMGKTLLLSA
jgi:N-acetylglutamate synthase-like GNAT family acetyltransferase